MNRPVSAYHQSQEQIEQESVLISEAKKDVSKFAALYNKYYEQIFLFILKRVETEELAADITSQVFLKALTNLSKYRDMGLPFSSWLFRIARNELYDQCYSKKVEMVLSVEKQGVMDMISQMSEGNTEKYDGLYRVLEQLEENEMELIEMRFFEDRAFKEIGEILDITETNARVRTYRVVEKLKKLMANETRKNM